MSDQEPRNNAPDNDDHIISGHMYDGIEEYDNPMPPWWVWIFILSIIWTPFYILGVHQFDWINSYEEDLAAQQAEIQDLRAAAQAANPVEEVDDAYITAFFGNTEAETAGAASFGAYCAACHGSAGEGLIGPNLTDEYWIHGDSPTAIFTVITKGVLEKGMTPWESMLTAEERAHLVAYVQSLRGSDPPNAKEPQGELVAPSATDEETGAEGATTP